MRSITISVLAGVSVAASLVAQGGEAVRVGVEDYERTTVYHSPQTPGFTCWVGLWKMPDGSVMLCFTQATGPLGGWRARAPKNVRERLWWPPAGRDDYDMTGLVLENVHLRSTDGGKTWEKVSADPFSTCANHCTGMAEVALADGTVLRAVFGQNLPYGDAPQTGYIQRSTDASKTWGPPELLSEDPNLQVYPWRLRVLSDGRIVVAGAAVPYDPDNWTRSRAVVEMRSCIWVSQDRQGTSWSPPLYIASESTEYWQNEFDVAELGNGDLLAVYRTVTDEGQQRRQNVLIKNGDTWEPTPVVDAPLPTSGHPELLTTREGLVLHVATNGTWWTTDRGAIWTQIDVPGTAYYPRSVQLDDGTIMAVGHVGGDDAYGEVDQSIVMDTYRIAVSGAGGP